LPVEQLLLKEIVKQQIEFTKEKSLAREAQAVNVGIGAGSRVDAFQIGRDTAGDGNDLESLMV
jgi:hypothetical protein